MTLTTGQAVATILVMAAVTFLTRVLPFVLFGRGDSAPKIVRNSRKKDATKISER